MTKKTDTLETTFKWHDLCRDLTNRPALSMLYADDHALVSANGYAMHITYGDYRAHADDFGMIRRAKSADVPVEKWLDYTSVIPHAFDYSAQLTVGQLTQAVKIAHVYSRDSNHSTVFVIHPEYNCVAVIGRSIERGDAVSHVAAGCAQTIPYAVSLNAEFVLDALKGFEEDEQIDFRIGASTNGHIVMIGNNSRAAYIMPMSGVRGDDQADLDEYQRKNIACVDPMIPTDYNPPKSYSQQNPRPAKTKEQRAAEKAEKELRASHDYEGRYQEIDTGEKLLNGRILVEIVLEGQFNRFTLEKPALTALPVDYLETALTTAEITPRVMRKGTLITLVTAYDHAFRLHRFGVNQVVVEELRPSASGRKYVGRYIGILVINDYSLYLLTERLQPLAYARQLVTQE